MKNKLYFILLLLLICIPVKVNAVDKSPRTKCVYEMIYPDGYYHLGYMNEGRHSTFSQMLEQCKNKKFKDISYNSEAECIALAPHIHILDDKWEYAITYSEEEINKYCSDKTLKKRIDKINLETREEYYEIADFTSVDECKTYFLESRKVTTLEVYATFNSQNWNNCFNSNLCRIEYLSDKKTMQKVTAPDYTVVDDYMGYYSFKDAHEESVQLEMNFASAWYIYFNENTAFCPTIYLSVSTSSFDPGREHIMMSVGAGGEESDIVNTIVGKAVVPFKGKKYVYDTDKKQYVETKDLEEDHADIHCGNFKIKGLGDLEGEEIGLKLKYERVALKNSYLESRWNLTFGNGTKEQTFKGITEDNLNYYQLNFNVKGLGANPKIYISESETHSAVVTDVLLDSRCGAIEQLYIFPTVITTSEGKKEEVYLITHQEKDFSKFGSETNVEKIITFDFGSQDSILKTFKIFGYLLTLVKVLIPLMLIIFGSIDFSKASLAGDEKEIQAAVRMLIIRSSAGVIIFFVPTLINFAVSLIWSWTDVKTEFENCHNCLFEPSECDKLRESVCKDLKCKWNKDKSNCECNN